MRVLRIAPARQLSLFTGQAGPAAGQWHGLPEQATAEVLALLARLPARGAVAGERRAPVPAAGEGRGGACPGGGPGAPDRGREDPRAPPGPRRVCVCAPAHLAGGAG